MGKLDEWKNLLQKNDYIEQVKGQTSIDDVAGNVLSSVTQLCPTVCNPLDCNKIQPVHSKGDQPWVFFGRTDAKAETPVLWPPHAKSWLIGKDSDAGRDWGQEEKGMTEDEMAEWHHRLDGHEFE